MEALLDKLERELSSQMVALLQQSDDLLCSVQIGEEGRAETEGGGGVDGDPIAGPNIARHLNHDKVLEALDSCTGTLQEMMSDLQESAFRSVADDAGLRGPGPACSSRNALRVEPAASQEATAEEPTTSETPQLMPQVLRRHASWGTSQASTESEASSSDVQLRRQPQCEQTSRRRGPAASLANKASLKQQSTQALRRDTQESDDTAEADAASKASTARAAAGGSGGLKPAAMPASLSAHFIGRMAQLFDSMFSGTAGGDERAGPNTAADADVAPGTPRLNSRDLPAQESGEAAAAAACADAQGSSRQRCTTWFSGVAQDV